ncbi:hypothetical protein C0585_02570 [Candidatus Woesearchaeota archaeon]|nr:MAG: hypothetical protein C0585_02570 [Candidatus Woesearchaeota archaeon]
MKQKVAVSTEENTIESIIDQRFGRCKYFMIIEIDDEKNIINSGSVENQGALQGHGAGIRAAQQLGELGVEAVITGRVGPNATTILEQLGIKAYNGSGIVKEAIQKFLDENLEKIEEVAEPHNDQSTNEISKDQDENEKIFFPLLEDKGIDSRISEHFGHAPFFGLYDVKNDEFKIIGNDLNHSDPNKSPIDQIEEAVNPTTIFAKGIGGRAINIIRSKGLGLKTGDFNTVKEAIENIEEMVTQENSCGHEDHH